MNFACFLVISSWLLRLARQLEFKWFLIISWHANVLFLSGEALPKDVSVLSAFTYGSSAWSVTARINCLKSDMSFISYFVKVRILWLKLLSLTWYKTDNPQCVENESGKDQLSGEFEAMSELYKTKPNLVPKPIAWGRTVEDPTYFFLCEYLNISDRLPDPAKLATQIADLHKSSVSPTGKFGFHVPTYDGKLPQVTDWDNSWP